jgi:cyclophilin family peptidyl-prolyl cis-trans isomerase
MAFLAGCSVSGDDAGDSGRGGEAGADPSHATGQDAVGFQWPSNPRPLLLELEVATHDRAGAIEIELMPDLAPESVAQLSRLAREGQYDGTTFHRVIRGFMIQGGDPNSRDQDPTNDGQGGAFGDLPDEFSRAPFERGVVALANRGRQNSNSSQFFILQSDHRDLDGRYTAVGRVVGGMELVDAIANTPTDKVGRWGPKDRPIENVSIRRARIIDREEASPAGSGESNPPGATVRLSQRPDPMSRRN